MNDCHCYNGHLDGCPSLEQCYDTMDFITHESCEGCCPDCTVTTMRDNRLELEIARVKVITQIATLLSHRFRELQKEGMTLEELSEISKIGIPEIENIFYGKSDPSLRTISLLASAMGCELEMNFR